MVHAAIIAALYAVLTHMQNLILPGSASWAIQMRLSEALCVLAFFTPAAVPGLTIGCLLFNLTFPPLCLLTLLWVLLQRIWLPRVCGSAASGSSGASPCSAF